VGRFTKVTALFTRTCKYKRYASNDNTFKSKIDVFSRHGEEAFRTFIGKTSIGDAKKIGITCKFQKLSLPLQTAKYSAGCGQDSF